MFKYAKPLFVFVGCNLLLLVAFLFLNQIGAAGDKLKADTTAIASTFWNWNVIVSNTKLWFFMGAELAVLYYTGKAFLEVR